MNNLFNVRNWFCFISLITIFLFSPLLTFAFSGGGGSIYAGLGSPSSIDAASELADDLDINDEEGNFTIGAIGFYQADRYRLGGGFQMHAWGGTNPGDDDTEDDTAGLAAVLYGAYGTYTIRHDRLLLNAGAFVGAGKAILGFDKGEEDIDETESTTTFYIEPLVSFGIATCPYFGIEFQISSPIFLFSEEIELRYGGKTYIVEGDELSGVNFVLKLTFGKFANP